MATSSTSSALSVTSFGATSAAAPTSLPTIRLGDALLYPDELPNGLKFGLRQTIAKMEYLGGGRHVQPIGPQQDDISWAGVIRSNYPHSGMSASDRAAALKRTVAIGKETKLTWLKQALYVMPSSFETNYRHENRIDYVITLVPVRDVSGATTIATVPSADSQVSALLDRSAAQSQALQIQDQSAALLSAKVSATAAAVKSAGPVSGLTGTAAGKAVLATAQDALATAHTYLNALGSKFPRSHIMNAQGLVTSLSLMTSQLQAGESTRTVTVNHGTIEDVALSQYGDITLARALQRVNNLPSGDIERGVITRLIIPPFNAIASKIV